MESYNIKNFPQNFFGILDFGRGQKKFNFFFILDYFPRVFIKGKNFKNKRIWGPPLGFLGFEKIFNLIIVHFYKNLNQTYLRNRKEFFLKTKKKNIFLGLGNSFRKISFKPRILERGKKFYFVIMPLHILSPS